MVGIPPFGALRGVFFGNVFSKTVSIGEYIGKINEIPHDAASRLRA